MFKFIRPEFLLMFLLGVASIAVFETILSYQALNCSNQQQAHRTSQPSDKNPPAAQKADDRGQEKKNNPVSEPFVCGVAGLPAAVRQFMNHNEGFFVGTFTFALVIVTAYLVWATLKLWKAGETQRQSSERIAERQRRSSERTAASQLRSMRTANQATLMGVRAAEKAAEAAMLNAKAAIGMELPIIRADRVPGLINVDEPPSPEKPYKGGVYSQSVPNQFSVCMQIEFQNHGRTPAFPIKLVAGWKVVASLPTEPDYFYEINSSATAIIKPDDEEGFTAAARFVVELSTEQREMLQNKTAFLWLYVSLHYRDFLNLPHEARFCWRRQTGGFGTGGAPPALYTVHT